MEQQDWNDISPAIWLVFGGSYLNHDNAPPTTPDKREKLLVDLLRSYLSNELSNSDSEQIDDPTLDGLNSVQELLKVWSEDLDLIYQIRVRSDGHELLVRQMVQRFSQRIKSFENITIIPSGLIAAQHTHKSMKPFEGHHDHVNLAILKKRNSQIDWVHVNPGSAYHQNCPSLAGDKSNAFFEITDIRLDDVTEEWLYLLVGLKAVSPGVRFHYKEVSLYENLLVHLNGKTVFQSQPDEDFIYSSPISPVHTWQVVDQSFRYLLQHFLGDTYHVVYRRLLTGFKLSLMEKRYAAYQKNPTQECHFLLQEMCCYVAQQALDQGNEEQKTDSLKLIDSVKIAIEQFCSRQELQSRQGCQLGKAHVSSLSFVAPRIIKHTPSADVSKLSSLKVEPVLVKPTLQDDIIDYLQNFKLTFISKLVNSNSLNEVALLSHGIEIFFIEYLTKTDILQKSTYSPFSRDDSYLAKALIELAEIYYSCQAQLVNRFLSNLTYEPHFYAKNVIVQFYVYAAVAALNFRDQHIGPLLATHNLSVATSKTLSFNQIIPHFVINDQAWLKVVFTLKRFIHQKKVKTTSFLIENFVKILCSVLKLITMQNQKILMWLLLLSYFKEM